jgi:hypothetical protein
MTDTAKLGMTLMELVSSNKETIFDGALITLDALVQLTVITSTLSAAPGSPTDGDVYIVKATGSGAWAGHDNDIAAYELGAWRFHDPAEGWLAYLQDTNQFVFWNGTAWVALAGGVGTDAKADGSTKGIATFLAADFNDNGSGLLSLDYTNGQAASGSTKGFLTSSDWTTFNAKVSTSRAINTTSPLSGGGDLSADRTLTIANAQADGSTKGAATFPSTEFTDASGLISLARLFTRSHSLTDAQTDLFEVALPAGAMAGGVVLATLRASDGTNHQALSQVITWAAVNKAGTYTLAVVITPELEASALSSGTLTATWDLTSGTNKATLSVTPTGSLTETTYTVHYTLINNSPQAITML